MERERALLVERAIALQADLSRSLHPTREWLETELTTTQLKVMFLLSTEGCSTMTRIAEALGVTHATCTGVVNRLVEHGLVHRRHDRQDRRRVVCRLTEQGLATVGRLQQGRPSDFAHAVGHLSLSDLRQTTAALETLCLAVHDERGLAEVSVLALPSYPTGGHT